MRVHCLAFLLLAGAACGQTMKPVAADHSTEGKVGPDDPVITINDFCVDPAQPPNPCKTIVTRSQFEKLTGALQPGMSLSLRLNVANAYARNLRMSTAAEKRGLDKTPTFEEEMRFARMQLLAQDLSSALQAEADNISDADIANYYKKNEPSFEQATLARIFVPRTKQSDPAHDQEDTAKDAMAKVAADLRARAANGEDLDELQIEAYSAAGFERTTPSTKMETVRRDRLPPRHETVFNLKAGEVSEVFSDPGGARFIYKMISKQTLSLEEAKPEIRAAISSQRYRDSMKPFQGNVVFSDAYFNPPGKPSTTTQRNPRKRRRPTPTEQD